MVLISRKVARTGLVAIAVLLSVLSLTPGQAAAAVPEPRFGPERAHPGYAGRSLVMEDFTGDGRKDVATTVGWSPDASVAYKLFLYA